MTCENCIHYDICNENADGNIAELMKEPCFRFMDKDSLVEVKHGRWIMRGGKRYCSECGQRACVTRDSEDFWYTVGTDYCPNCGAKMDGERKTDG